MSYTTLMEQARKLVHDARQAMDANEGDNWSQEKENSIAAMLDDSDNLKERAETARRIETGVAYFDAPASAPVPAAFDAPPGAKGSGAPADELDAVAANASYHSAFNSYVSGGMTRLSSKQISVLQDGYVENKTLTGNTGVEGGFLMPPDFRAILIEEKAARSMLREKVNVVPTSGPNLEMPKVEGAAGSNAGIYANGIVWTYVNSPAGEDDGETEPEFGLLRIPMNDAVAKTRLGINMVSDSAVSIETTLPRWYGEAAGLRTDYDILVGTGMGQPLGILTDTDITGTFFVQTAGAGAIASDDLLGLVYDLEAQYAVNAEWITSRTNLLSVRKLKDSNNNYYWRPGLVEGEPDTLMGYRVNQSPFAPGISAGNFSFVFGDLKNYALGEAQRITLSVLREKYIEELKIGYMGHFRQGGQAVVARAFRVLKIKS